jgi:hypothetical protein
VSLAGEIPRRRAASQVPQKFQQVPDLFRRVRELLHRAAAATSLTLSFNIFNNKRHFPGGAVVHSSQENDKKSEDSV